MSTIYFHNQSDDARVRGTERYYAASVCHSMLMAALSPIRDTAQWLVKMLPSDHYIHSVRKEAIAESLSTLLMVGDCDLQLKKETVDTFTLALNTALVSGSDPVKLLARLHGQCEIHCYVEEEDAKWLADIIALGRNTKVLRPNVGWESVMELLSTASGPTVCSYSVCDQFPNIGLLPDGHKMRWDESRSDEENEEQSDAWYGLDADEQWQLTLPQLRKGHGLRITPDHWDAYYFGSGISAFHLKEMRAEPTPEPKATLPQAKERA